MSQDFNVRVDHHFHFPRDPGHEEITHSIRELKDLIMPLADQIAALAADDTELAAEVTQMSSNMDDFEAIVLDIPARIQAAVASALADAGVEGQAAVDALNNVDSSVKVALSAASAALAKAKGVLTPTGTDTTTDTSGNDTVSGAGGGDQTVVGGQGDDTLGGGTGNDSTPIMGGAGGPLEPPTASGDPGADPASPPNDQTGAVDTGAGTGSPAVPPPSQGT